MSELQTFLAMLERCGIGHGQRFDFNPPGTGVQIEHEDIGDDGEEGEGWFETDWQFDADGKLISVTHYRGEVS